jgi:hypothetical protein
MPKLTSMPISNTLIALFHPSIPNEQDLS